ncbi:MAG: Mth938-like domain-containing protein [Wenzhouxiangella sp.]
MMQLTEQRPGAYHYIRRVAADQLIIDDRSYQSSLILGARLLIEDWPVGSLADLDAERIEPLLAHQPELVLLGHGDRPSFLSPQLQSLFLARGIGLECMTLAAACRTFNVLMSENRRAVAGLILPSSDSPRPQAGQIDTK